MYSHVGYDGFGRKLYETPPVSSVTYNGADKYKIFTYDAAGRVTMVMLPEVPNPDNDDEPEHPIYRYYYDVYGNQIAILDPLGRVTMMEYDSQNRPVRKYQPFIPTNPSLPSEPTTADILGIDLSGKLYEETTYDPHGRVEERVDCEGHTTVYRYYENAVGTDDHFMSGTPSEFRGIPGQLRIEENYDGVPGGTPDGSIVYTYDKLGRKVKEVKDTTNTYEFSYDDEGRILILESPQGDLYYEYDPQTGRKVSTASYPSTMTFAQILADATATPTPFTSSVTRTVNTYDDLGRLETVQVVRRNSTDVSETATTYAYNDNGSQEKVIYPNGNEVVNEYDALNRLYRLTNYKSSSHLESELLSRFEYSCFADGQRATAEETYKGWKEENSIVQEVYLTREMAYRYDGLGRLIWEQRNDHDPNSFTYDLVGNRISQTIGKQPGTADDETINYSFNERDQLYLEDYVSPTIQDITYVYDANGSLTSQTQGTATTIYVYDLRNRLKTVTADSITTTYGYSPDGSRVRRQIGTGTPTVYLVDPMNLTGYSQVLEAWSGGATPTMTYTIGGDVIAQAAGSTVRFLIYDGHGSVRNHANSTGALVWFDIQDKVYKPGQPENDTKLLTYDAWGQECNGLSDDGLYYTGEMYDQKLSMYNLRARWYSPATGRFNAADSFDGLSEDPQSLHRYLYAHCDPINSVDPSGQFTISEIQVNIGTITNLTTRFFNIAHKVYKIKDTLEQAASILKFIRGVDRFITTVASAQSGAGFGSAVMQGIQQAFGISGAGISSFIPGINQMFTAIGNQWNDLSQKILDKVPTIATQVATDPGLLQVIASHSMTGKEVGLVFNLPSPPVKIPAIPPVSFRIGKSELVFRMASDPGRLFGIQARCSKEHFENILRIDYLDFRNGIQYGPHYHVGGDLKTHHPL